MSYSSFVAWDISTILFIVLVVFFITAVVDKVFLSKKRTDHLALPTSLAAKLKAWLYFVLFLKFNKSEQEATKPRLTRWSLSFYPVILLVFVLRSFVIEPFQIPSNSMMPSLLTGDYILVNKFAYGVRLPVTNTKLIDVGQPERGDILVFRYPNYQKEQPHGIDYIKRVVALPGDRIAYVRDQLFVNGKPATYQKIGSYQGLGSGAQMSGYLDVKEQIDSNSHHLLLHPKGYSRDVNPAIVVPEGMYFVMGDNRAHSADSRFWGFVPEQLIIGKAFMIWLHLDWGERFTFSRFGLIDE